MKPLLNILVVCLLGFLLACGGKSNNPMPANPSTGGTTGAPGPVKIIKNILINNVTVTYVNNAPNTFEFTNNAGTDIVLTVAVNGTALQLTNTANGTASSAPETPNGLLVTYSNIAKSIDDRLNTDSIAMKYANDVYIKIPADKTIYGYDEIDAFLDNDGYANAGYISITGSTTALTTVDVPDMFNKSKVVVTRSAIQ